MNYQVNIGSCHEVWIQSTCIVVKLKFIQNHQSQIIAHYRHHMTTQDIVNTGLDIKKKKKKKNLEIADSSTKNFYLILQHHVENTKIKQLLRKNWTILGSSDLTSSLFQSRLICGASRNPRLRDMLVRSSLPLNPQFGKTGKSKNICTNTSCKYCHSLDTTGQIRSNKLGRNFPSKHSVCCKSHNLVYCLTCNICGLQYVGQTKRTFHLRLYEHFRDIQKLDLSKPLGRHFTLPNHTPDVNHITSHILAFITKPSNTSAAQQMRLKFEREWIYRLRTNLPHGLNAMDWRCHFYPYPLPYSTFF